MWIEIKTLFSLFQEIFEISHNGENCTTESVKRFSTREFAVMNCASGSHDTKSQKTIIAGLCSVLDFLTYSV